MYLHRYIYVYIHTTCYCSSALVVVLCANTRAPLTMYLDIPTYIFSSTYVYSSIDEHGMCSSSVSREFVSDVLVWIFPRLLLPLCVPISVYFHTIFVYFSHSLPLPLSMRCAHDHTEYIYIYIHFVWLSVAHVRCSCFDCYADVWSKHFSVFRMKIMKTSEKRKGNRERAREEEEGANGKKWVDIFSEWYTIVPRCCVCSAHKPTRCISFVIGSIRLCKYTSTRCVYEKRKKKKYIFVKQRLHDDDDTVQSCDVGICVGRE